MLHFSLRLRKFCSETSEIQKNNVFRVIFRKKMEMKGNSSF